ncbi:ABC transporter ATP-binding protein [Rhodococcus sp. NPDC058514]|uniref:ABC transporter ATP-binding protein n=1 Tax=unclassified Rhodococcus (in: high G+C Gram-positive bacteria) TaxID=192944 RepID=UPI00364F9EBD
MTETVLSMHEVHKSFRRRPALRGCTFEIPRGTVTALVGANGAGKSTVMSLAVGLLAPDSGSVSVLGKPPNQNGIRSGLSYLAQHRPLYPKFSVADILRFGAHANTDWDGGYAAALVDAAGIPMSAKVKALSPGHRTRVALALTLGRRPEVLLLDEPLADLDPLARRDVAQTLMQHVADHGTTVVLSSHVLAELTNVADHLLLLGDGRVRLSGEIEALLSEHYVLAGSADPGPVVGEGAVIDTRTGAGQSVHLVRGPRPAVSEGWSLDDADLDDLVLAHLGAQSNSIA